MIRYTQDGKVDRTEFYEAWAVAHRKELADALDAANAKLRALEAAPTPATSEEVERVVALARSAELVFEKRAMVVDMILRLDRERQALQADRDSWERQASDRVDDCVEQINRAERAEAELARVTGERDAAVKDAERYASAIRWALGYDEGAPQFGEQANQNRYGWREELRRRAAMKEPTK